MLSPPYPTCEDSDGDEDEDALLITPFSVMPSPPYPTCEDADGDEDEDSQQRLEDPATEVTVTVAAEKVGASSAEGRAGSMSVLAKVARMVVAVAGKVRSARG